MSRKHHKQHDPSAHLHDSVPASFIMDRALRELEHEFNSRRIGFNR